MPMDEINEVMVATHSIILDNCLKNYKKKRTNSSILRGIGIQNLSHFWAFPAPKNAPFWCYLFPNTFLHIVLLIYLSKISF